MPSSENRKKALQAYKERKEIGGLYRIINTKTGWESQLCATPNLQGMHNRFSFAQKTNTRFDEMLKGEWERHKPEDFAFIEVEQLEKKPEMTAAEFREELSEMLKLHEESDP